MNVDQKKMNKKRKNTAARWPAALVDSRYWACSAHSKQRVKTMPARPVSRKKRRPMRSTKKAVKTLPGKETVTQSAERRRGL